MECIDRDLHEIGYFLHYSFYINIDASGSKSEAIVQLVCHSISVSRFVLLHGRKYTLTHMCFQTLSAFLVRNFLIWEIYLS